MNWKIAIPNSLTMGNMLCGTIGIICSFHYGLLAASIFMLIAAVLDFFDGMVARLLGVSGELGKQLDSLADMVTFGVLPGIMLFHYISIGFGEYNVPIFQRETTHLIWELCGLIVALFSDLRLAIFNIDTRQSDVFIGVPTPANALLIASIPIIMQYQYDLNMYHPLDDDALGHLMRMHHWPAWDFHLVYNLYNPNWYIIASFVLSFMLVMQVPLLNFKFKNLSWEDNKWRFAFLGLVMCCLVVVFIPYWINISWMPYLDFTMIPIVILLYVIFSIIKNFFNKKDNEVSSSY